MNFQCFANIYLEKNELEEAEKYYIESLNISIEIKDEEGEMYVYENLGKLYINCCLITQLYFIRLYIICSS